MEQKKLYIVSCRADDGLCDPKVFKTEDAANKYVNGRLAGMVREYVNENGLRQPSKKTWESDEKLVAWAENHDIIFGLAFAAYSDWTEFAVTEVTLPDDFADGCS